MKTEIKGVPVLLTLLILLTGCNQGDFGAKICAVYQGYDRAAFHLQKYLSEHEDADCAYWMFLGAAEMYRGEISQMHSAFDRVPPEKWYPEFLLLRCNWFIETGNIAKAKEDYRILTEILKNDFHSFSWLGYRAKFLLKILEINECGTGCGYDYNKLLFQAAELMNKKLTIRQKTPFQGLFTLRNTAEAEWKKIVWGMKQDEFCQLVGNPQKMIESDYYWWKCRIFVYCRGKELIGFYFSKETERLGMIMTFPVCPEHGYEQMRFLRNYNKNQVKKKKIQVSCFEKVYYDDIFCYREPDSGYWRLSDFKWLCLECVRQNRMKENE